MTIEHKVVDLHEDESAYHPIDSTHRLSNKGRIPFEFVDFQVGSYLGEDDNGRLEDDYHRS